MSNASITVRDFYIMKKGSSLSVSFYYHAEYILLLLCLDNDIMLPLPWNVLSLRREEETKKKVLLPKYTPWLIH